MRIIKELQELVNAEVISQETSDQIKNYYKIKDDHSQNRLFILFGIFGAILTGLGIILIIAHNWDELSRSTKAFFAFLPIIAGQGISGFTLYKKQENITWLESSSVFLFFAVGICISLISQIYNIPGNLSSFLLTWMLLCFPLIYIMKSSATSLLYIGGITWYACETCYWSFPVSESYIYWGLLFLALPYYFMLSKNKPGSNFTIFHNWLIPLTITIVLGTVAKQTNYLLFVTYMSLFGLFFLIGNADFFKDQRLKNNGYLIIGSLGTLVILLVLSFSFVWKELLKENYQFNDVMTSPEFLVTLILSVLAGILFYLQSKNRQLTAVSPAESIFIVFIIIFITGFFSSTLPAVLINLLVLLLGIWTIRTGAKQDHLGILNYGLLIITALAVCRFFDKEINFVTRGILFVLTGISFFATNYRMLKKRKTNEEN